MARARTPKSISSTPSVPSHHRPGPAPVKANEAEDALVAVFLAAAALAAAAAAAAAVAAAELFDIVPPPAVFQSIGMGSWSALSLGFPVG